MVNRLKIVNVKNLILYFFKLKLKSVLKSSLGYINKVSGIIKFFQKKALNLI